ncbi:hypothetical protein ACFLZ8_05630, partial [Planctomycetota bacterium]
INAPGPPPTIPIFNFLLSTISSPLSETSSFSIFCQQPLIYYSYISLTYFPTATVAMCVISLTLAIPIFIPLIIAACSMLFVPGSPEIIPLLGFRLLK